MGWSIEWETGSILCMHPLSVRTHVESLNDPRVERTRRPMLMDIPVISVMAVVCPADGWHDTTQRADAVGGLATDAVGSCQRHARHGHVGPGVHSARPGATPGAWGDSNASEFASDDSGCMAGKSPCNNRQSVVMVDSERTVGGKTSVERRHDLTSRAADAAVLGVLVEATWGSRGRPSRSR